MTQLTIEQAFDLGVRHHQAGRLREAEQIYGAILARYPDHGDALHSLGILSCQTERFEIGADLIRRAIALRPDTPGAHSNLGNALMKLGQMDEAIEAYRRAIGLEPDSAEARYNLGNALEGKGRLDEAIAAYREAITLNPGLAQGHYNLGNALKNMGRADEAIAAYRRAIELNPNLPDAFTNLGNALKDKGQVDEAIAAYRQAIILDTENPARYQSMAGALELHGRVEEAIGLFKAARARSPAPMIGDYDLAALGVGDAPAAAPREYMIELFNGYSAHFDEHLQGLDYKGPQLLLEAVTAATGRKDLSIIDLGCGTGLCGVLFRPMARHLTGVDVAPRMIDRARQRGVYDELRVDDLTAALKDRPAGFDLILAADVFIYVGDLASVFEAAARALRPRGMFAFTIESIETGDYILRRSRRYAQSLDYIRRLSLVCGLSEVSVRPAYVRTEANKPVDALVIVLRAATE